MRDGGQGDDSFPSWGLEVEADTNTNPNIDTDRKTTLLYRQPYEKSRWLGQVVARWAEVEFVEAAKE